MEKNMKAQLFFKFIIKSLVRQLLKVLWIFPVRKNRILFNTFIGKHFSCNPKYMFLDLYAKYGNSLEYIWCRNEYDTELATYSNVRTVKFRSFRYVFVLCTCGVYITNNGVDSYIPKRKKQLFIDTWHGGGAYKSLDKVNKQSVVEAGRRSVLTDYFVSSCAAFTKNLSAQWCADVTKFLPVGMPRNDLLLREKDNATLKDTIKVSAGIPLNKKAVLYAPTFRGLSISPDLFDLTLDAGILLSTLEKRFGGEFVFLFRCHHTMLKKIQAGDNVLDVSSYNDMQELLLAADVLVTDYSSSIWDWSLMFKPCFLFTPDLDEYDAEQGFYTPFSEWPFPYGKTNEELSQVIAAFDEEAYRKAVRRHHEQLGSFEKGTATAAVNTIIEKHIGISSVERKQ